MRAAHDAVLPFLDRVEGNHRRPTGERQDLREGPQDQEEKLSRAAGL
jgi:hypothetical protein